MLKKFLAILLAAVAALSWSAALAVSVPLNGTVVNTQEETVVSLYGGAVEEICVQVGDSVQAGDVLATLKTTKVYALQDGVVRLFGSVGESVEMIANLYGAVAYVEPTMQYTAQISTKTADANNEANRFVHPGETVYLRAVENMNRTGTGTVTSVAGGSFNVILSLGSFASSDSVNVYRDPTFTPINRLGKGTVSLVDPVAYTGEGIVTSFAVENGAQVKKGDILFETVAGSYDSAASGWTQIKAPCSGIIASLNMTKGTAVAEGSAVATLYADDGMRIEATVSETDLLSFHVGDNVIAEFTYLNDGGISIRGVIEKISRLGEASSSDVESEEAWFTVSVKPNTSVGLYYGAHAIVSLSGMEVLE